MHQIDDYHEKLRRLVGPPFNYTFNAAIKAVANGTADQILAGHDESQAAIKTEITRDLEALKDQPNSSQISETRIAEDFADVRFFVCKVCNGNFCCGSDDKMAVCSCAKTFAKTEDAIEVTDLVKCGKLSVLVTAGAPKDNPPSIVFAVRNRPNRNVEQTPNVVVSEIDAFTSSGIATTVAAHLDPVTNYIKDATKKGARTSISVHYHNRGCGIERTPTGDYLRREGTGDMRMVAQVIVRDQKNEADGSLLFAPVYACARCGEDHKTPIAFWKLTQPVQHAPAGSGGLIEVLATHFGFCPKNGEPIMMVSSIPVPEYGFNFNEPAGPGQVEKALNPIDHAKPVELTQGFGLNPIPQNVVQNTGGSEIFQEGYTAGVNGRPGNPHRSTHPNYEEWERGFVAGKDAARGE